MKDALQGSKWDVFPAYEWKDWLDEKGRPVVVPAESFKSPAAVWRASKLYGETETGPVLGRVLDSGRARTIEPMSGEHVALFKTFAELSCADRDEITAFASTYGSLRRSHQHQHQNRVVKGRSGAHYADGESHLTWAVEIVQMREALKLSLDRSREQELAFRKAWTTQDHRRWKVKPPYEKDRKRLTTLINIHLEHVQPRIVLGESNRLSYRPLDLLSSIWLQFTLSLTGGRSFRKCKMCERIFEISTEDEGYNTNREFCDRAYCRTKHLRKRKKQVLELAFSETPPPASEIAEQTGTTLKAVKAWIKAEKKKRKGGRR